MVEERTLADSSSSEEALRCALGDAAVSERVKRRGLGRCCCCALRAKDVADLAMPFARSATARAASSGVGMRKFFMQPLMSSVEPFGLPLTNT